MSGRAERELKIEAYILDKLSTQPEYLTSYFNWMSGKKPLTKRSYIARAIHFCEWCAEKFGVSSLTQEAFDSIDLNLVNEYVRLLSLKSQGEEIIGKAENSSLNTQICELSCFFRFLKIKGWISENLCLEIERPAMEEKENVVYLEQEEIQSMLLAAEKGSKSQWRERNKLLLILPLVTGIRVSALVDINIEDLDLLTGNLKVIEKEGKYRIFPLPQNVIELAEEWIEARAELVDDYESSERALFVSTHNGILGRICTKTVNRMIKKFTEDTGKTITAHKLRSTFAMSLYEQTNDIYLVSELLGHKSTETTKRYVRATEEKKRKAITGMSNYIGI